MKDKLRVWKETDPDARFHRMWRGECRDCGDTWQFWFWGATLGFAFQHRYHGCYKGSTRNPSFKRVA